MNIPFIIGCTGAIILVLGAAYPIKEFKNPYQSLKNWLFAIGGVLMLIFAALNYLSRTGEIFFIFLQVLVNIASILMMMGIPEKKSTPIIILLAIILIIWSLTLFENTNNLFFIIGLSGIAAGYTLAPGTFRRNAALTFGSVLIALFSYLVVDWVFFWLNIFFAMFSGFHSWKLRKK